MYREDILKFKSSIINQIQLERCGDKTGHGTSHLFVVITTVRVSTDTCELNLTNFCFHNIANLMLSMSSDCKLNRRWWCDKAEYKTEDESVEEFLIVNVASNNDHVLIKNSVFPHSNSVFICHPFLCNVRDPLYSIFAQYLKSLFVELVLINAIISLKLLSTICFKITSSLKLENSSLSCAQWRVGC